MTGEIPDPGVLTMDTNAASGDGPALMIAAQNTGKTTWRSLLLSSVDAAGKPAPWRCPGPRPTRDVASAPKERSVRPGGTAHFGIRPCGRAGETRTFNVRVFYFEEPRFMAVTPLRTLTVQFVPPPGG